MITFQSEVDIARAKYIETAKNLPLFDPRGKHFLVWSDFSWDVTEMVKLVTEAQSETVAFHHARRGQPEDSDLISEGFLDLIKAFVATEVFKNSKKSPDRRSVNVFRNRARDLRCLDTAWIARRSADGSPVIDKSLLNAAVDLLPDKSKRVGALTIRRFVRELEERGAAYDVRDWSHPALEKKSRSTSRIRAERDRKGLTDAEVSCLAEAYRRAELPLDRFTMAVIALLMCTPSRKEEVFILPHNAEIVDAPNIDIDEADIPFNERRGYKSGLRWWPVKGGPPQVKFVPREMMPVAISALQTIRAFSEGPRELAQWMEENPGRIRIPHKLDHILQSDRITRAELDIMIPHAKSWLSRRSIGAVETVNHGSVRTALYSWTEVQRAMLESLPRGWPLVSRISKVSYSEALCSIFFNQFNDRHNTQNWMVELISRQHLEMCLTGRPSRTLGDRSVRAAVPSIFERLGIRLPDGKIPAITSHQIRHYLNTVAQRARVPESHIAYWSGRKNVMQNEVYDHSDMLFEVEQIKAAGSEPIDVKVPIVDDSDKDNLSYLSCDRKMRIHSTPYGYCTRSLLQEPCDRAGACSTCTRLVCLGGSSRSADLLARDAARDSASLSNLEERLKSGQTVSLKTVESIRQRAARSRILAEAIMDPINFGALIKNTEVGPLVDFSHDSRVAQQLALKSSKVLSEVSHETDG